MSTSKTFTLTLPRAGMEIVFAALAELPYRLAQPVIDDANAQIAAQVAAQSPPPQTAASQNAAQS